MRRIIAGPLILACMPSYADKAQNTGIRICKCNDLPLAMLFTKLKQIPRSVLASIYLLCRKVGISSNAVMSEVTVPNRRHIYN